MSVEVNFYWVVFALVCVLALLSLLSHVVVRRHTALVWLAAALTSGAISTTVFVAGGSGLAALSLLAIFDTIALFCVAQAIRLVVGAGPLPRPLMIGGALLTLLSLGLMVSDTGSVVVQCLPFQLAGLLFVASAALAAIRLRRGLAGSAIVVGIGMHIAGHLARMPFFPSLLDSGQAYPSFASPWLNLFLLFASSVYVPLVVLGVIARDLAGHIDTFREASMRDGLTSLLTRLAFEREARAASPRFGALVVADLDLFKSLNDTYGHVAGDDALRAFAALCASAAPLAGRMGGEEFALLLPGASIVEAQRVAESIQHDYRRAANGDLAGARLTASFGIAAYQGRETFREALQKADRALYRAKRQGRDCIMLYGTAAAERAKVTRTA